MDLSKVGERFLKDQLASQKKKKEQGKPFDQEYIEQLENELAKREK